MAKVYELINQCQGKNVTPAEITEWCMNENLCSNVGMFTQVDEEFQDIIVDMANEHCQNSTTVDCHIDDNECRKCIMAFLKLEVEK